MDERDRNPFAQALVVLAEMFEKKLSVPLLDLYFTALCEFDWPAVEAALAQAARTCRFFPRVAELCELIEGAPDDRGEQAWMRIWKLWDRHGGLVNANASVYFEDQALAETIVAVWGDWPTACQCPRPLPERMAEYQMCRKNFLAMHRQVLLHPNPQFEPYLTGRFEQGQLETYTTWERGLMNEPSVVIIPRVGEPKRAPLSALKPGHELVRLYERERPRLEAYRAAGEGPVALPDANERDAPATPLPAEVPSSPQEVRAYVDAIIAGLTAGMGWPTPRQRRRRHKRPWGPAT